MLINASNLQTLFVGFKGTFAEGVAAAQPQWSAVAMRVPSGTREEEYGLGFVGAGVREWLGDRVVHSLGLHSFRIRNRTFEQTVSVNRDDIADDRANVIGPVIRQMGMDVTLFPDQLVFDLLKAGFTEIAYDGQPFFDTDHPVIDANGQDVVVSNTGGGSGEPWFLIDSKKAFRPLILQEREPFNFVRKDDPSDDNVFMRREFLYGVDGRLNAGLGLWQLAYGSKEDLTADSYAAGRVAMMNLFRDGGTRLGIMPDTLVVGSANEQKARQLLFGGDRLQEPVTDFWVARSNEWMQSATLVVSPFI